ncbi:fumarylacetoacetate hydrolase family protein [Microvirga massiliensis]|uniref:fumarylacetoacetate hydrolase family protein n=1 Tax=Microvirga massiliensis TaxID=1033741 RepID=UPI00062B4217|nr:fumarylacetoacetate hydrolase family protein [Microvirga massiliensis]
MRLCRIGEVGTEKPGMIDAAGNIRDLSSIYSDIDAALISPRGIERLAKVNPEHLPLVQGAPRIGAPVSGTSKFICIGLNYSDHALESGLEVPSEPIIFLKATSAICGPNDDIIQPKHSKMLDWEVELGVIIGTEARYVSGDRALDYVAGYCVVNDISERAFQMQSSQWDKGKGCDTFGPIGPWLVTTDEIRDPQNLEMWLDVNGERMQAGNTRTMIFDVRTIVSYCSHYMTLLPGDIIATGTPPGVGMGKKPDPIWLTAGDIVTLGIQGLGEQKQKVTAWLG